MHLPQILNKSANECNFSGLIVANEIKSLNIRSDFPKRLTWGVFSLFYQGEGGKRMQKDDDLKIDAARDILSRLYRSEIIEKRSYRGFLYTTMGFGPESYTYAQEAGFIDIHNSVIWDRDEKTVKNFMQYLLKKHYRSNFAEGYQSTTYETLLKENQAEALRIMCEVFETVRKDFPPPSY